MKKTADQMMTIINNKLTEYAQSIRVVEWSGNNNTARKIKALYETNKKN